MCENGAPATSNVGSAAVSVNSSVRLPNVVFAHVVVATVRLLKLLDLRSSLRVEHVQPRVRQRAQILYEAHARELLGSPQPQRPSHLHLQPVLLPAIRAQLVVIDGHGPSERAADDLELEDVRVHPVGARRAMAGLGQHFGAEFCQGAAAIAGRLSSNSGGCATLRPTAPTSACRSDGRRIGSSPSGSLIVGPNSPPCRMRPALGPWAPSAAALRAALPDLTLSKATLSLQQDLSLEQRPRLAPQG
eukprot:scaffold28222_cov89-Phaeocystis_antarctica.AAC.6